MGTEEETIDGETRRKMMSPSSSPSSSSSSSSSPTSPSSFWAFSRRQWLAFGTLSLANLCTSTTFSCIVPFFPTEAKLKGLSTGKVGLIIGVFQLVMFCTSPVFGKMISRRFGSDRMFISGLALCGLGSMSHGLLYFVHSPPLFFSAAILMRCATALGNSAFRTSSLTQIAHHFPAHVSSVVGLSSVTMSVGYMVGPTIGSGLYELGGFSLPFFVLGFFILCSAVVSALIALCTTAGQNEGPKRRKGEKEEEMKGMIRNEMRKEEEEGCGRLNDETRKKNGMIKGRSEEKTERIIKGRDERKKRDEAEEGTKDGTMRKKDGDEWVVNQQLLTADATSLLLLSSDQHKPRSRVGLLRVLRVPEVALMMSALFVMEMAMCFYDASLADHLSPLLPHHPSLLAGLMLSLTALLAMLTSPLCGLLVDHHPRFLFPLVISGSAMGLLFPLLMGPSPLLRPLLPSLSVPLVSTAFALQGLVITAEHTPSFRFCIDGAKRQGFDGMATDACGCISGLLNAAISLGAFAGVVLGGLSVQWIGFEWTGTWAGLIHFIPLLAQFSFWACSKKTYSLLPKRKMADEL